MRHHFLGGHVSRATVLAGLAERDDREALWLALEMRAIAADVVTFTNGFASLEHLRHCSRESLAPNRRWPEIIVFDESLREFRSPEWRREFGELMNDRALFTPILFLGGARTLPPSSDWPVIPEEKIVRVPDARDFLQGLGSALWYWLRCAEIVRRGDRPDEMPGRSGAARLPA